VLAYSLLDTIKCINSEDEKPKIVDNVLECDLRTSYDENLSKKTFGFVKRIDFASDIELKVAPQTLIKILGEQTITLPTQPVLVDIVMGNDHVLPTTMKVSPVLTKTGDICSLKFTDVEPNISNLNSSFLPSWVTNNVEKLLNNSERVKDRILKFTNDAALKIRNNSFCKAINIGTK
ncbi:hypothetical protein QUF74_15335, partial [Candidatus Halobeggiatoa sp. HSG11]|nr:hypothetical protein [Candidatus Halobeggiatoa sp. HSG11]